MAVMCHFLMLSQKGKTVKGRISDAFLHYFEHKPLAEPPEKLG